MVRVILGVVMFLVVMRFGLAALRNLGRPLPPPPPPGEMRRVSLRYRCTICGTEVKMTHANDEMPEAPRHCLEDMQLLATDSA